ncbi:hypothetical protein J421_2554 [Gemmatirosa kalamazoonensis]|uniref:Uncharacterized protein n=1 Tax=Gemmatirosa kalamazoonensis TaxID=861299 RepID=W0RH24_9BACT|nr:hypothetical protein [Gemmatirosa kalamazoonensis]AHG90091.1 hypothetical protein J421_2554 [Gemmatirosa kalamazoonensis]
MTATDGAPVHVEGIGPATMRVEPERRVVLARTTGRDVEVRYARIVGVAVTRGADGLLVVLHLVNGGALRLTAAGAPESFDAEAARLVADVFSLPELMRGMRAYGAGRALPGSDHDRFFAPLVEPLRALRASHERALGAGATAAPWRVAESVGATRAAAEIRAALGALAASRYPASAPDRRALEAELLDETEPLFAALDELTAAAQRLGVASERDRVAAWRAWCSALGATFVAADRCWAAVLPALNEAPSPRAPR